MYVCVCVCVCVFIFHPDKITSIKMIKNIYVVYNFQKKILNSK